MLVLAAAGAAARLTTGSAAAEMAAELAALPDRGVATRGGLVRLALLAGQGAWVAWLAATASSGPAGPAWAPLLRLEPAWAPLLRLDPAFLPTTLGPAGLAYALALVVLAGLTVARGEALVRGLLWATVAALAAQLVAPDLVVYALTAGGLVLVVGGRGGGAHAGVP